MKWQFTRRKVNELYPQRKNPRKITKAQREELEKSIKKFGEAEPIVITKEGIIIGGHQRYQIYKKMGAKEVEVMECQDALSDKEIDELSIRLNKNTGQFDIDLLANGYDPEDLLDWGFTMEELQLESVPDQEEKPKLCQLTAKFENEDDLRQAEIHIAAIIDQYASASYKVKVK